MNMKIDTRFEQRNMQSPDPAHPTGAFYSIPNLIHFLPGCAEHSKAWRDQNPEFAQLVWDHPSLESLRQITPHLCQLKSPAQQHEGIVYASMLAYHYGG
eukprot:1883571-Pleurochrysis_carterae.AAC.3